ncbi:urease accessory protein UreE [Micromonospora sp. NBC_01796]|uniref:urease accessory protein UreE n=1 Tax=Micromonospora sp. NBC_01796 TaxID=2975987 RepID=UPI002DD971CF|nr:urease accessory protein UreE [Micromonospora sp. NBC_01796]WSA84042.1 urease accessory protein UreE [Micromonospora sp. NBC_01796]
MLVESVLGNASDPGWKIRLDAARVDDLLLDQWEAQKNRLRKRTVDGDEVALSLGRGHRLRDGDILRWDETTRTAVVARIQLGEVMVIDLSGLGKEPAELGLRAAIELGHAIGNQHWPAVVKDNRMYVPLTVDRKVMDSVMRTHDLTGVSHDFVPGTEVIAYLAPHESRRLFGGAGSTPHSHAPQPVD